MDAIMIAERIRKDAEKLRKDAELYYYMLRMADKKEYAALAKYKDVIEDAYICANTIGKNILQEEANR